MNVRICACIRNQAHPTQIAVYDPTCTQNHAPPSLYRPDRTHHALGRLIRLIARIALAVLITWLFITDATDRAWWQWALAIGTGIPLACLAMPVPSPHTPTTAKD